MKLAVISDIHSNFEALKNVYSNFSDIDKVVCLGDLVGYGPSPTEVVDFTSSKGFNCIKGNHDGMVADPEGLYRFNSLARAGVKHNREKLDESQINFLENLPLNLSLDLNEKKIECFHGSPRHPLSEYIYPEDADESLIQSLNTVNPDYLFLGHTHIPFKKEIRGTTILNPGSVGQPRDGDPRSSYAVVDLERDAVSFERVEYDIQKVKNKVEGELPSEIGERLEEGR
ncbi:MAG: metallophosphoesterase [Candidatus Nanohaloarchaea archaeon]